MSTLINDDPPDLLDLPRLRRSLAGCAIGHTLYYAASLPSTMPAASAHMADPASRSGLIVVAEEQSAGRGRHGREWVAAPATALLVSVALKAPHLRQPRTHLAMAAGLAALEAVAELVPTLDDRLWLKWPNDLLLGPTPRQAGKLGGILIQSALTPQGRLAHAVIGIGLNANQTADQLPQVAPPAPPPTSLRWALGAPVDRTALLIALCHRLAAHLETSAQWLRATWRSRLGTLGQQVAIYTLGSHGSPVLTGLALDVDADGALLIQDDQQHIHTVHAGDVSLRWAG